MIPPRTVTLELLRHGPPHNQLLSPLTPYLALARNHAAETVRIDVEHHRMLKRLAALRYRGGQGAGEADLREAVLPVKAMLDQVRPLAAELTTGGAELVHLRIISSAAELALLPFELLPSILGPDAARLVITREVRHARPGGFDGAERPRILFAAASPRATPIPDALFKAHYLALGDALAPWLVKRDPEAIRRHVTVLPQASLGAIQRACAEREYTHVHLVAHGVEAPDDEHGARFGLSLHDEDDPVGQRVVSGQALAEALSGRDGAPPQVVTLASCDSGNQGTVIAPGSSVAHALHEAGIPLVIGSQFPLSERGSVILARLVYARLLQGEDPRAVLHALRKELRAACPDAHDWASLIAYAALPPDLDARVAAARVTRLHRAIDAALARLDHAEASADAALHERSLHELTGAMRQLHEAVPTGDSHADRLRRAAAHGLLANAKKRWAQHLHDAHLPAPPSRASIGPDSSRQIWTAPPTPELALQAARDDYIAAFRANFAESWAAVQALAIDAALGDEIDPDLWAAAHRLAIENLHVEVDRRRRIWALNALTELQVLAQRLPDRRAEARKKATEHLRAMIELAGPLSFDAYSLLRQLRRYAAWWWKGDADLRALPEALVRELERRGVPTSWETA